MAWQVQLEEAVEQLAARAAFRKQDEPHPARGCGFHQLSWGVSHGGGGVASPSPLAYRVENSNILKPARAQAMCRLHQSTGSKL